MTKDFKDSKFRIGIFIISFVVIYVLTTVSFLAAWAKDEGQIDEKSGLFKNFLADSAYFFRLPTHGLFWDSISRNSSSLFLPTLVINVIFWSVVTERLISLTRKAVRIERLKSNVH